MYVLTKRPVQVATSLLIPTESNQQSRSAIQRLEAKKPFFLLTRLKQWSTRPIKTTMLLTQTTLITIQKQSKSALRVRNELAKAIWSKSRSKNAPSQAIGHLAASNQRKCAPQQKNNPSIQLSSCARPTSWRPKWQASQSEVRKATDKGTNLYKEWPPLLLITQCDRHTQFRTLQRKVPTPTPAWQTPSHSKRKIILPSWSDSKQPAM